MTKVSICLVVLVICTLVRVGITGNTGQYKNWHKFTGSQVGLAGKGLALNGTLPKHQSGCCGKHVEENNGDDEGSSTSDGDEDNRIDGGDDTENNHVNEGNDIKDYDIDNEDNSNNDADEYEGNDFGNDDETIDDDDKIFNDIGLGDGGNLRSGGFIPKHLAKENASDIAPDKYITAGKAAGLRQFPWLVHLNIETREWFYKSIHTCGGSLISPRYVLTAAHCVQVNYRSYDDVSVVLSEYDTRTFPRDCVGRTCVQNVVMHPDKIIAHRWFGGNSPQNDIALIRLRGSAPYTEYIRPISLPSFNIDSPRNEGAPLIIAGWGNTGRQASPIKLWAQVQLVPHQACRRHYLYGGFTTGQVCAAGHGGQDTCHGDSGGPLVVEQGGNFFVVGIVSGKPGGIGCGSALPTVYTNVYEYRQWIDYNMRY